MHTAQRLRPHDGPWKWLPTPGRLQPRRRIRGASPAYLRRTDGQTVSVGVGTRVNIIPVRSDSQGSLERASSEISRAYGSGSPTPVDLRNTAEAYRVAAAAADDPAL